MLLCWFFRPFAPFQKLIKEGKVQKEHSFTPGFLKWYHNLLFICDTFTVKTGISTTFLDLYTSKA
jgi:hypothetical protein